MVMMVLTLVMQVVLVVLVMLLIILVLVVLILQGLTSPSQMKWNGEGDRTGIGKIGYTSHGYSHYLLGEQQTEERGWYSQARDLMDWL